MIKSVTQGSTPQYVLGKKVKSVWRRDACPGQEHAEPKRELKKSNCMLRAREMKAA
ncbi:MAG: hypothetical protein M0T73_06525 [Deltaproteobacteria bacterium]|nr:hypothetical protein [Deltaproteobacteria bacterium]